MSLVRPFVCNLGDRCPSLIVLTHYHNSTFNDILLCLFINLLCLVYPTTDFNIYTKLQKGTFDGINFKIIPIIGKIFLFWLRTVQSLRQSSVKVILAIFLKQISKDYLQLKRIKSTYVVISENHRDVPQTYMISSIAPFFDRSILL